MKRKKFMLTLLIFIFTLPMLLAWFAYSKGLLLPGRHVNRGTLLQPTLNIATLDLKNDQGQAATQMKGKWWLIYIASNPMTPTAEKQLYYIRQIRQATGKDRDRIERGIILQPQSSTQVTWVTQHFPGMQIFTASPSGLAALKARTPKKLALEEASLYLVDPLGNIMMYYAPDAAPKGILKDLLRVLKVSQIG